MGMLFLKYQSSIFGSKNIDFSTNASYYNSMRFRSMSMSNRHYPLRGKNGYRNPIEMRP